MVYKNYINIDKNSDTSRVYYIRPLLKNIVRSIIMIVAPIPIMFSVSAITLSPICLHYLLYVILTLTLIPTLYIIVRAAFMNPGA